MMVARRITVKDMAHLRAVARGGAPNITKTRRLVELGLVEVEGRYPHNRYELTAAGRLALGNLR